MRITAEPGDEILHTCDRAVSALADGVNSVEFCFNGFELVATPGVTASELANEYFSRLHRIHRESLESARERQSRRRSAPFVTKDELLRLRAVAEAATPGPNGFVTSRARDDFYVAFDRATCLRLLDALAEWTI